MLSNTLDLREQYPEYASILVNKLEEVKKEIFLHNHRPIINIWEKWRGFQAEGKTLTQVKKWIKNNVQDPYDIIKYRDIEKKNIPTLQVVTFARLLAKPSTKVY